MNNADFKKLLASEDLSRRESKDRFSLNDVEHLDRENRREGRIKVRSAGKARGKTEESGKHDASNAPKYRDRAAERRREEDMGVQPELISQFSIEQSKFLGGDIEHTHLVRGLDFNLLRKTRGDQPISLAYNLDDTSDSNRIISNIHNLNGMSKVEPTAHGLLQTGTLPPGYAAHHARPLPPGMISVVPAPVSEGDKTPVHNVPIWHTLGDLILSRGTAHDAPHLHVSDATSDKMPAHNWIQGMRMLSIAPESGAIGPACNPLGNGTSRAGIALARLRYEFNLTGMQDAPVQTLNPKASKQHSMENDTFRGTPLHTALIDRIRRVLHSKDTDAETNSDICASAQKRMRTGEHPLDRYPAIVSASAGGASAPAPSSAGQLNTASNAAVDDDDIFSGIGEYTPVSATAATTGKGQISTFQEMGRPPYVDQAIAKPVPVQLNNAPTMRFRAMPQRRGAAPEDFPANEYANFHPENSDSD